MRVPEARRAGAGSGHVVLGTANGWRHRAIHPHVGKSVAPFSSHPRQGKSSRSYRVQRGTGQPFHGARGITLVDQPVKSKVTTLGNGARILDRLIVEAL